MPRRKAPESQLSLLEPRVHTAPCVPAIKQAVNEWRAANYKGVTETTRLLLNHWFRTDHRLPNGRPFVYFDAQKFAVETLI
jgi:type III restriction enzyme